MENLPDRSSAPLPADASAQAEADLWNVQGIVGQLAEIRRKWRTVNAQHAEYGVESFPSRVRLAKVVEELCGALFPLRLGPDFVRLHNEDTFVTQTLQIAFSRLQAQVRLELTYSSPDDGRDINDDRATQIVLALGRELPEIRRLLDIDIEAAFRGDPSARSLDEVLICFPGLLAIIHHRLAHKLHLLGAPLVARIISEISHGQTGIDIHPGAQIGEGFFIDHGTGVVIGETAILGDNVRIYQGVTLGAKNFPLGPTGALIKSLPRHPVIENNVVIYAGATILGRVTIGAGSEIGGNVWLTHDVPPFSRVYQAREQNLVIRPSSEDEAPA
ncbi:serine O-acetyltransferase [Novosphingobium chloroacetimidivorans]|uniref:serine O-acetyltransferase n=1 Tax=Novosphingobium chloroacetimidivorans TaxID=1428314 RepID=A0A7W7NW26_9SPHN|nr:serine O-acetyltransferase EpsC [Novosphingobium chloroacetimidivorans]MBB4858921.1 serine O-acetyltransferase [Novosphingobium chloroacetimidivorans]